MKKTANDLLIIKGEKYPTVLAISEMEQQRGLMNCYDLPPSMSFVYSYPKVNKFWMKNTPMPLDIVFCKQGKVVAILKGEPYSTSSIGPDSPTDLVVEFPHGTCAKMGVSEGDEMRLLDDQTAGLFSKKYY